MSNIEGKVVVITGASSGIGEATARILAACGARVILGARRTNRLNRIVAKLTAAGQTAAARATDVTDLDEVKSLVAFAQETFGRVDVMVNNAGIMPLSKLEALRVDEWNQMIDVNIRGVLHGIAAALPLFKRQGSGHFVNVSSIRGHVVVPASAVYSATKFAVRAISEGLRQESPDVRVTVISPGVTESELAATTTDPEAASWLAIIRKTAIPADAVGRAIAYAIEQPADVDVNEIIVRPTANVN